MADEVGLRAHVGLGTFDNPFNIGLKLWIESVFIEGARLARTFHGKV